MPKFGGIAGGYILDALQLNDAFTKYTENSSDPTLSAATTFGQIERELEAR